MAAAVVLVLLLLLLLLLNKERRERWWRRRSEELRHVARGRESRGLQLASWPTLQVCAGLLRLSLRSPLEHSNAHGISSPLRPQIKSGAKEGIRRN